MSSFSDDELVLNIFALSGALGAIIMFVADLILYYPTATSRVSTNNTIKHRTAKSYFSCIDPSGNQLAQSSMQFVSLSRAMLGGVLGPVSAMFYSIGFLGIYFGLQQKADGGNKEETAFLPIAAIIAAIGLSLMMIIAGVYHALFAYTCFLSKEIAMITTAANKKKIDDGNTAIIVAYQKPLLSVLNMHKSYLRYIYKWAAMSGLIGSIAYVHCLKSNINSAYPLYSIFFVPVGYGPIKKLLKKYGFGGIVLCGGLTNLWNLCFFACLYFR